MNVSGTNNNQPVFLQVPQDKIGTSAKQGEGEENNACTGVPTPASPSTLLLPYTPTPKRRQIPRSPNNAQSKNAMLAKNTQSVVTTDTTNVQSNFGYVQQFPSKATVGASVAHPSRPVYTAKSASTSPAINRSISTDKSQPGTFVQTEKKRIGLPSFSLIKTPSENSTNHLGVSKCNDSRLTNNRHAENETSISVYCTLPRKPSSKGAGVLTGSSKLPAVGAIGRTSASPATAKKCSVVKGNQEGEIKKEASGNRTEISSRFGFGGSVQRDRATLNQACSTVQEPVRMNEHTLPRISPGSESVQSSRGHKGEVVQDKALFSRPTKSKKAVSFNDEEPVIKEVAAETQLGQTEKKSQASERGSGASKHYNSNTLPRCKAKTSKSLNSNHPISDNHSNDKLPLELILKNNEMEQEFVLVNKPEPNLNQSLTHIDSFSVESKHVPQSGSVSDVERLSQQVAFLSVANEADQQNTERQQVGARESILGDGDNSFLKTGVFAQQEQLSRRGSSKSSSGGFTSEACDQVATSLQEKTDAQPGHKVGAASAGEVSQQISINQSLPVVDLVEPQKAGYEQFGKETIDNVDWGRKRSKSLASRGSSDKGQKQHSASEPHKFSLRGMFNRSKATLMFTDIVSKNVEEQEKITLFQEALATMDRSDLDLRYDFLLARYKIVHKYEHDSRLVIISSPTKIGLKLNQYMLDVLKQHKEFFEPLLTDVLSYFAVVLKDPMGGDALKKSLLEQLVPIFSAFDQVLEGINALSELRVAEKTPRTTEARDKKGENSLRMFINLLETKRKDDKVARIALVGLCNDFMQALQAELRRLNAQDIEKQYNYLFERMITGVQSKEKQNELRRKMQNFKDDFDKEVGFVLSEQQSAQVVPAEPATCITRL